jgi:hypothetical protein
MPKVGKDANGLPVMVGVQERVITQNQADYSDINKAASQVSGAVGNSARQLLASDPTGSAGLITSLAKTGAMPDNELVNTLSAIDKQTQTQRQLDVRKESARLATDRFNQTPWGGMWTGLKALSRGAAVLGNTILETISAPARTAIDIYNTDFKALKNHQVDWTGKPLEGKTRAELGLQEQKVGTGLSNILKQTTVYNILDQGIKDGKIDLGTGFFPSEEIGAGFAARQEQLKQAKVSFEVGGKTYYRPYSLFDPAAYLLTLGHPESSAARVINALGDIGLSVALDPTLAFSKAKQAQKLVETASMGATGIKAARLAQEKALLAAQIEELSAKTEASLKAVSRSSSAYKDVKTSAYIKNFKELAKVKDKYGNIDIDYTGISNFLSGGTGEHIIDAIANTDDWRAIQRLSKGKLTVDESVALSRATTREEVLTALAPFIADGKVIQNSLERGSLVSRGLSTISKGAIPAATETLRGWAASALQRMPLHEKFLSVSDRYHAFLPDANGTLVHISNKDKLVETVNNVAVHVGLDRTVTKQLLDDIALSADSSKSGYTASAKLFDAIFKQYKDQIPKELQGEFKQLTRVFEQERSKLASFWASRHAQGAEIEFMLAGGKRVTTRSSHLDSELLNSFVYIPSGEDVLSFVNGLKKFGKSRAKVDDILSSMTSTWKKSVMVRPAYITRNIAEEQIRVFASGHVSFFNHPLAAMAMWLGRDNGPKWRAMLNHLDKYDQDVFGNSFKMKTSAEELNAEVLAQDLINPYVDFMGDAHVGATRDGDMNKVIKSLGYQQRPYGHERWWEGYASQLRILHNSDFVQRVLATKPGQQAKTVDYFLNGAGKKSLDFFLATKDADTQAFLRSKDGLTRYLFTGKNAKGELVSVKARIEELAGGGRSAALVKKLLKDGTVDLGKGKKLNIPSAVLGAEHSIKNSREVAKGRKQLDDLNKTFSEELKNVLDGKGNWDNVLMTIPTTTVKTSRKGASESLNDLANGFFQTAVRFEKTTTMGPEWRQSYWDAMRNIVGALDKDALDALKKNANTTLSPLRNPVTGKNIGKTHPIQQMLFSADGKGPMTLQEAHDYASHVASKKVEDLFYNASKRRLIFHQMRLVAPFIQAWEDTLKSWGKLAADNPVQIYKATKALNWLSSSESSALYSMTDARDFYDPNQGFFFKDPNTGERKFFVPLAGAALNLFQGMSAHPRVSGPFALSATPQSFNFALGGGSILPGFGPGVSISTSILDSLDKNPLKILPAGVEEEVYRVFFPYGTPDIKTSGIINAALLSSNWTRILGSVAGVEGSYAAAFAPSMNYLADSGKYDINNPEDQHQLIKDTNNLARFFTMWRGVFGAFMPIPFSLRPEALAKSKDGNTVLATALYADFKNLENAAGSNKNKAYADFLDTYGPEQIFAILRTTTNYEPTNLPTYNLIKDNPSVLSKYPDVYGTFYPNGELSQVLYKYQQARGSFNKMSSAEIMQQATQVRYYAALDRLRARSIGESWSSEKYKAAQTSLSDTFKMRDLTYTTDTGKSDRIIKQLTAAAADPSLVESDAITGLRDYLYLRDKALEASGMKTLKNAASEPQRVWLADQAKGILAKNPNFQKMYYSYFMKELEG